MRKDLERVAEPYRGVVFDFDGTLFRLDVDWDGLRRALACRFDGVDFTRLSHGLTEIQSTQGPVRTREAFEVVHRFELAKPPIPIQETIDLAYRLQADGRRLAIFSANTTATITSTLEKYRLQPLFSAIIGGDSVRQRKPHCEGLWRALDAIDVPCMDALYIADGEHELETGRRAEVRTILYEAA